MQKKQELFTAAIETTRGCAYSCDFCFVNNEDTFESRWSVRNNKSILQDINTYYKKGLRKFFFFNLEFFGSNKKHHEQRAVLFREIKERFQGINFMLYARADTLMQFDKFNLLKEAGLYNVYLGAESFFQNDLDSFKKRLSSKLVKKCINELLDRNINIFLSLILFNRSTTIESLKYNLNSLENILKHENAASIRMQTALVNIEHSWGNKELEKYPFSDNTYTKWTMYFHSQNTAGFAFDSKFEPLIEIMRALSYENEKKSTELNFSYISEDVISKKGMRM